MLKGRESAVAIKPPHKKAAANNQGVSRSRRSRNQSLASGMSASRLERISARKNTLKRPGGMLVNTSQLNQGGERQNYQQCSCDCLAYAAPPQRRAHEEPVII